MVNTNIRLTREQDIRLLPDIERSAGESFRKLPELAWIADDCVMSAETHLQYVKKGTSWVAAADEKIVGFICAEFIERDLHIWLLAVRQEWQCHGIGRRLMDTAIKYAQSKKFEFVTLTTFREVPWNEPFYRSLGFEVIETTMMEPRLEQILQEEIQHGIPGVLRCAMQLSVSPADGDNT